MATKATLSSLPPQPLPKLEGDLAASICVTIWWLTSVFFALFMSWLLRIPYAGAPLNWLVERSRPTWDIFRSVCLATGILAVLVFRWGRHLLCGT